MRQQTAPWLMAALAALALTAACSRESPNPNAELQPTARAVDDARDEMKDAWITTKIEAKFFADEDIKARRIDVTTNNGVVSLSGRVDSENVRQHAVSIARNTDGVVRVEDRLSTQPEAAATTGVAPGTAPSRDREPAVPRRVGEPVGNAWLTTKIQAKYFADPVVKGRRIDVTSNNGVVTLNGTVTSEQEHQKAIEIARTTEGVRRVEDRLQVMPGGAPVTTMKPEPGAATQERGIAEQMTDAGITARIQSKFFLDDVVKGRRINVNTSEGVVTLQGEVANENERQQAVGIARSVEGVRDVKSQLQVAPAATTRTSAPPTASGAAATVQDPWITTKIQSKYFMDDLVRAGQIGVTANQGVVTLTGQVPSAEAKGRAEALALQTEGVARVENRLTVGVAQTTTTGTPPPPPQ
jgi:osmotically-inducible protein OsmY